MGTDDWYHIGLEEKGNADYHLVFRLSRLSSGNKIYKEVKECDI